MGILKMWNKTVKQTLSIFVMLILTLGIAACGPQQKEIKEVHVKVDGSDESGDGSIKAPYKTVSAAAKARPGSPIIVHEGEYGPIELGPECSGSKDSPTVIRPAEGEKVLIQAGEEKGITLLNVRNIQLEGLETEGGTHGIEYTSTRESGDQPLDNIIIRNCKVHDVQGIHGICVYASNDLAPVSKLTIEGCEVFDCACGSSESVVLNGNVDGFLISGNIIHDNNNIGIDMIGFEGYATHSEEDGGRNPYEVDMARNGVCRDNVVYNISTQGNAAYYEDGEYDPCADGIYVDGGQNIEIFNNFIFNCDIGLEVATEHSPEDNELFRVSGIQVHDNVIAGCHGWTGICFGGYDKDLGFTEECVFDHNTLIDNSCQIGIQRSRQNKITANLIIGGETGVEFNEDCRKEDMINEISGNACADIEDQASWSEEYGEIYPDRADIVDGFRSLIDDVGSRFVPDKEIADMYISR